VILLFHPLKCPDRVKLQYTYRVVFYYQRIAKSSAQLVILESLLEIESRNVGGGSTLFKSVKLLFSCLLRAKLGGGHNPSFEVDTTVFCSPIKETLLFTSLELKPRKIQQSTVLYCGVLYCYLCFVWSTIFFCVMSYTAQFS
jgi:hypothetical protein